MNECRLLRKNGRSHFMTKRLIAAIAAKNTYAVSLRHRPLRLQSSGRLFL